LRLEFASNLLLLLREQGRIQTQTSINLCNEVFGAYIHHKILSHRSQGLLQSPQLQEVCFLISVGVLGSEKQIELLNLLLGSLQNDTSIKNEAIQLVQKYFTPLLIQHLFNYQQIDTIYNAPSRETYF